MKINRIINEIFLVKLDQYRKEITIKEYISKQIRMLDNRFNLLAFIERKIDYNISLSIPSEGIYLQIRKGSSKSVSITLEENFETFKWHEEFAS